MSNETFPHVTFDIRRGDWIQTYSGLKFYSLDPRPEDVCIGDIARALSMLCRFGGHVSEFISVAQHSVLVSFACDPADALWGLLHDASEAYLVDLPRPIKLAPELVAYRDAEERLMAVICEVYGLDPVMPESVRQADDQLLVTEAYQFKYPLQPDWERKIKQVERLSVPIRSLVPHEAEVLFLERFHILTDPLSPVPAPPDQTPRAASPPERAGSH